MSIPNRSLQQFCLVIQPYGLTEEMVMLHCMQHYYSALHCTELHCITLHKRLLKTIKTNLQVLLPKNNNILTSQNSAFTVKPVFKRFTLLKLFLIETYLKGNWNGLGLKNQILMHFIIYWKLFSSNLDNDLQNNLILICWTNTFCLFCFPYAMP